MGRWGWGGAGRNTYARVWQPVLDLTAYHGIELALYFTALHAAVLVAALLIYGLLFATIPALLYFVLAGSKRFCSTVIGLPDERLKNFMAAGFLAVTLYAGLRMAIS